MITTLFLLDAPASVVLILRGFYWWRQQQESLVLIMCFLNSYRAVLFDFWQHMLPPPITVCVRRARNCLLVNWPVFFYSYF